MSRSLIALIVVIVLLIGGLFVFAGRDTTKEQTRVEKVIPLENLTR